MAFFAFQKVLKTSRVLNGMGGEVVRGGPKVGTPATFSQPQKNYLLIFYSPDVPAGTKQGHIS